MSDAVIAPAMTGKRKVYRHRLVVRLTHWVNALCIFFLVGSGLQIFNAHPALYWGEVSTFNENNIPINTVLSMGTFINGEGERRGFTQFLGSRLIDTTGFLGLSQYRGQEAIRGFPSWMTIELSDLAAGRLWHFFLRLDLRHQRHGLCRHGLAGRHSGATSSPRATSGTLAVPSSIMCLRFRTVGGCATTSLQKLAYIIVIVALILMVVTGLCMSPGLNASVPVARTSAPAIGARSTSSRPRSSCSSLSSIVLV